MNVIEIKVTLEDIKPAVTRILQVPDKIRLDRLHLTIQAAMGWNNTHLYMFGAGNMTWGLSDPEYGGDELSPSKATLADVIEKTGVSRFRYVYDFGDGWEHVLEIVQIMRPFPGELYPRLTKVAGRCPPDDVGGYPGYEAFLQAMADPKHPEHEDLKACYGGSFDPNMPPADTHRLDVLKLAKRWRTKKAEC